MLRIWLGLSHEVHNPESTAFRMKLWNLLVIVGHLFACVYRMEWPYENLASFDGKSIDEILSCSTGENVPTRVKESSPFESLTGYSKSYLQESLIQKECELIVLKLQIEAIEGRCRCTCGTWEQQLTSYAFPCLDVKKEIGMRHSDTGMLNSFEERPQLKNSYRCEINKSLLINGGLCSSRLISCYPHVLNGKKLTLVTPPQVKESDHPIMKNANSSCLDNFLTSSQNLVTVGSVGGTTSNGNDQAQDLVITNSRDSISKLVTDNDVHIMEHIGCPAINSSYDCAFIERNELINNGNEMVSHIDWDKGEPAGKSCPQCRHADSLIMKMSNALNALYRKCRELQVEKRTYKYATKILRSQMETMQAREIKLQAYNWSQSEVCSKLQRELEVIREQWQVQQQAWMTSLTNLTCENRKLMSYNKQLKLECDKNSIWRGRCVLSERKRKSLVWQKSYFLKKLEGYEVVDHAVYKRILLQLDPYPHSPVPFSLSVSHPAPKKLRVIIYVICFIIRLLTRKKGD